MIAPELEDENAFVEVIKKTYAVSCKLDMAVMSKLYVNDKKDFHAML